MIISDADGRMCDEVAVVCSRYHPRILLQGPRRTTKGLSK